MVSEGQDANEQIDFDPLVVAAPKFMRKDLYPFLRPGHDWRTQLSRQHPMPLYVRSYGASTIFTVPLFIKELFQERKAAEDVLFSVGTLNFALSDELYLAALYVHGAVDRLLNGACLLRDHLAYIDPTSGRSIFTHVSTLEEKIFIEDVAKELGREIDVLCF